MILVTGGTGFLGSHLLYQLCKENDAIKAIYRDEPTLEKVKAVFKGYQEDYISLFKKIHWVKADITTITTLTEVFSNKIEYVYHCAAVVTFNPKQYSKMRKVNLKGTANLINFCIDHHVKKFCHVSSIATFASSEKDDIITEENDKYSQNESGYAITKVGAEMEVWRGSQEGLDVVIVNPGVILGRGFFKEGSGKLFSKVYKGLKYYTEGVTGFVGVQDVVTAMIGLMKSDIKNELFIVVAENKSFKEVLFAIADAFHKKRPAIKIGNFGLTIFWRLSSWASKITGRDPLLTKSSARAAMHKDFFSAKKLSDALSIKFTPIGEVINSTCQDYLKEN